MKPGMPHVKVISRMQATKIANAINTYSDSKVHPVEIMFQTFISSLNTDERLHLLALIRADALPDIIFEENEVASNNAGKKSKE